MKTSPTYQHEDITYTFARKWEFTYRPAGAPFFSFRTSLQGGVEAAHKVARIVAGALKRTNGAGLDALARANIRQLNA